MPPGLRVQARAHHPATNGQRVNCQQRMVYRSLAQRQLRFVATEFLVQRQRRGVLQMSATNLHDMGERARLVGQCHAQPVQGGQQSQLGLTGDRNMHGRGEYVV